MKRFSQIISFALVLPLALSFVGSSFAASGGEEPYPGYSAVKEMYEAQAEKARENAPRVVTLDSGVQIQRTPDEDNASVYHTPGLNISYNTYYLDADNRGCQACHEDLAVLLNEMSYDHVNLENPYGIEITVSHCLDCHGYSPGYVTEENGLGSLLHGLHRSDAFGGDCMSCHNATGNGTGMTLWDEVKHKLFRGIKDVADVKGDFSFTQDKTVTQEQTFAYNWMYYDYDYRRYGAEKANLPRDPDVFDSWTIKVNGHVDNPVEFKLADLIKEAPVVTTTMLMHCTQNPMGGPLLSNVEITGIPLDYLLKKAGIKKGATVISPLAPDGFTIPITMDHLKDHKAYLVYEIGGKRLGHLQGYPVQLWVGSYSAAGFVKQINEITVLNDPAENHHFYLGWRTADGGWYNKPNIGFAQIREGQMIEVGKPFTFEGFADAFEEKITSIELSMDRGQTWTSFDTANADTERWIYWTFTFTPENAGAYVLTARARTDTGLVSDAPVEIMVNAKAK